MKPTPTADEVLNRHALEMRCELLNLAATLDRIDRAQQPEDVTNDERLQLIRQGIGILGSTGDDRAERLQLLFSDPYESGWNS